MFVDYSGYSEKQGSFHCSIFINENKTDYEIHYKNGTIARQSSAFTTETRDWNHDGDVYPLFGAWFSCYDKDGSFSGGNFWTPEAMVRAVADAIEAEEKLYGNQVIAIPGVDVPPPGRRPSLTDHIRKTEQRALAQDIERYQKMKMLGIRPPNEPWAK